MGKRMSAAEAPERLMTLAELSELLGVPIGTLYAWRCRGEGPAAGTCLDQSQDFPARCARSRTYPACA